MRAPCLFSEAPLSCLARERSGEGAFPNPIQTRRRGVLRRGQGGCLGINQLLRQRVNGDSRRGRSRKGTQHDGSDGYHAILADRAPRADFPSPLARDGSRRSGCGTPRGVWRGRRDEHSRTDESAEHVTDYGTNGCTNDGERGVRCRPNSFEHRAISNRCWDTGCRFRDDWRGTCHGACGHDCGKQRQSRRFADADDDAEGVYRSLQGQHGRRLRYRCEEGADDDADPDRAARPRHHTGREDGLRQQRRRLHGERDRHRDGQGDRAPSRSGRSPTGWR